MYKNGEIYRVMDDFESALNRATIYVGGSIERADRVQTVKPDGRISYRYENQNYYNNGNVNQMFILYLHGYSRGKLEGRQ